MDDGSYSKWSKDWQSYVNWLKDFQLLSNVSFAFFLIWLVPCALARNIQTMLVARFLDGVAGSAFLS